MFNRFTRAWLSCFPFILVHVLQIQHKYTLLIITDVAFWDLNRSDLLLWNGFPSLSIKRSGTLVNSLSNVFWRGFRDSQADSISVGFSFICNMWTKYGHTLPILWQFQIICWYGCFNHIFSFQFKSLYKIFVLILSHIKKYFTINIYCIDESSLWNFKLDWQSNRFLVAMFHWCLKNWIRLFFVSWSVFFLFEKSKYSWISSQQSSNIRKSISSSLC